MASKIINAMEWAGEIPENWDAKRLKIIFTERKEKNNPEKTNFILSLGASYGVIPYSDKEGGGNKAKEDLEDYKLAYENDIVMNSMNIVSGAVGKSRYFGCVSPVYYVFYPSNKLLYNEDYFCYVFQTIPFQRSLFGLGNGILVKESSTGTLNTVRLRIPMEKLGVQLLPIPPIEEQNQIVEYLDKKIPTINIILEKTRSTIEDYKQLKKSIISETLSKSLNGNKHFKKSGIEWIKEIPENWDIKRGKTILTLLNRSVKDDDEVITCFRDGEVTLRSNRRETGFTFSIQEDGYQGIEPGDLVVHGMDGFAGAIGISDSRGKSTPVLNVMDSSQNKKYIMYYLRNMAYNGVFISLSTGIRIRTCDTNWNKIKNILFAIPPIEEQNQIVEYLDKKIAEIDRLIEIKNELIQNLEKYKKTVIYEAVTGKKEVA